MNKEDNQNGKEFYEVFQIMYDNIRNTSINKIITQCQAVYKDADIKKIHNKLKPFTNVKLMRLARDFTIEAIDELCKKKKTSTPDKIIDYGKIDKRNYYQANRKQLKAKRDEKKQLKLNS